MSFEVISKQSKYSDKYETQPNTVVKSCSFSRKGKTIFILVIAGKRIIIYDVKSSKPISITECQDDVLHATLFEQTLLYSTSKLSKAINWNTNQKLFESISGTLFPVNSSQILLLSSSTLYHYTLPSGIEQIKHFELGVLDFVSSPEFDQLAITSSVTYLYDPKTKLMSEMHFVMSKLLFCNTEYLCGISIDRKNVIVRSVMANITLCQVPLVDKVSKIKIQEEQLYLLGENKVRVWKISSGKCQNVLQTEGQLEDLLITEEAVYTVSDNLELRGVKRIIFDSPAKSIVHMSSIPENKENKPVVDHSLVMEDLQKTSFHIESQQFQLLGLISNFKQEHLKFLATMAHRDNCLKGIHKWWSTGNYRACITAIQHHQDHAVINDSLAFMNPGIANIPRQQLQLIIRSCRKLIGSKYSSYVQTGLTTMNSIMNIVNNEQIDCEAERGLLEEIKKVRAMPRLEKIMHSKISPERKHIYQQAYLLDQSLAKYLRTK